MQNWPFDPAIILLKKHPQRTGKYIKWPMYIGHHLFITPKESYFLVQLSHSVVSNSLWPHGLQHARLPCPSPTPRAYSNSCPSSQWCHPTISSSVVPFSSCLQSFPASGSFQTSHFFPSGGWRIGVSASASVLPMNIQDWFLLGWTGWKFFLGVRSFLWVHTIHIASVWYQRSLNDSPSRNEPVLRLVRCRLSCSGPDRHV